MCHGHFNPGSRPGWQVKKLMNIIIKPQTESRNTKIHFKHHYNYVMLANMTSDLDH